MKYTQFEALKRWASVVFISLALILFAVLVAYFAAHAYLDILYRIK